MNLIGVYPRVNLIGVYPRVNLIVVYPGVNLIGVYPRVNLNTVYPGVNIFGVYPRVNLIGRELSILGRHPSPEPHGSNMFAYTMITTDMLNRFNSMFTTRYQFEVHREQIMSVVGCTSVLGAVHI